MYQVYTAPNKAVIVVVPSPAEPSVLVYLAPLAAWVSYIPRQPVRRKIDNIKS